MKKSKLLTEKRMLIGLIGLLFVVTFVHTIGILNLSENPSFAGVTDSSQQAQVATVSICLKITPKYNYTNTTELTGSEGQGGRARATVQMYWQVKNVCTNEVKILTPTTSQTTPNIFNVQRLLNDSIVPVLSSEFASKGISNYVEYVECMDCSAPIFYPTNAPYATNFASYSIPSQATRTLRLSGSFEKTVNPLYSLRFKPQMLRWVNASSVADNNVASTEIISAAMPSVESNYWASDFVRSYLLQ
jgi:hypothetical protein